MPDSTVADIQRCVAGLRIADLDTTLGEAGARIEVRAAEEAIEVAVHLGFPAAGIRADIETAVTAAVRAAVPSVPTVRASVDWAIVARSPQGGLTPLPGVRNIIAVASGKGGVGKSTTSANLALALAAEGARVGLLDADVYGPSQPTMLGISGRQPESRDGKTFEPLVAHGIETMSVGFLVDDSQAMIWRGPMVTQVVTQLTFQTAWHDLDYLVVDLPPGTGDTQLTLSQKVPVAGVVIVTTPQQVAMQVARRGLKMFEKVDVPLLGIVENMSSFVCPKCSHEEPLFGAGGGADLAAECGIPLLGAIPLDRTIRAQTDAGRPPVVADPQGVLAQRYRQVARRTAAALARRPADQKHKFPRIVVERAR
ncbi:MAG: iron-sulfur cluster carrier protein ApbC [Gammaproteobacteria bacterium]|nr:iron-sulfur cluster carrier protein ApbC [Gammaproteobacteria bacterium]